MNWVLLILGILFIFFFLLVITKVKVIFNINHASDDDQVKIKFRAWFGILRYTMVIPLVKIDKNTGDLVVKRESKIGSHQQPDKKEQKNYSPEAMLNSLHDTKEVIQHVVDMHRIVRRFLKRVSIRELEWKTVFGIGDAALTGMLTGVAWTVKGSLLGFISTYMKLRVKPELDIIPSFQQACSETHVKCMIEFRIGHAMIAGIRIVKYWKGGRPKFKTRPLSNSPISK